VLRFVLGGGSGRGAVWQVLALASAVAVAGPSLFLEGAYVALRGERVEAAVVEEIGVMTHRIADPVTNEDLGILTGMNKGLNFYNIGDTVPMFVVRDVGLSPVPVERAGDSKNIVTIWLFGWVLGLGLTVVNAVRKGRDAPAG